MVWPRRIPGQVRLVAEPSFGSNRLILHGAGVRTGSEETRETLVVEIELKRAARNVIDRIVHLRDSL
jgi:hypothetical protein